MGGRPGGDSGDSGAGEVLSWGTKTLSVGDRDGGGSGGISGGKSVMDGVGELGDVSRAAGSGGDMAGVLHADSDSDSSVCAGSLGGVGDPEKTLRATTNTSMKS
jgi:hypothetical protein